MKVKKSYVIAGIFVVGAVAFAMNAFRSSLTPYVTVTEAMAYKRVVQVAGVIAKGSDRYDLDTSKLLFTLQEDGGDQMAVEFDGARPGNFSDAAKVVAIGQYDKQKKIFKAKNLLVKCPTKYEGRVKGK